MKTIKLFFIALTLFFFGFITSCTEETEPIGPTIDFIAGTDLITANATVETDQDFSFKCLLTQGDAKLTSFTIRLANVDLTGYPKTNINTGDQDSYSTYQEEAGTYQYTFILTDKEGLSDTKTITVTVNEPAPTITSYTDKVLGASQNNDIGSSFASIDGSVYVLADAKTNSNKVDFVYFYGATNKATIAAPSDADAQSVFSSGTSGIATWNTKNATVLGATTLTPAEFDAISSDTEISAVATGLTASKVNDIAINNVIAFETAPTSAFASKKGLIKITALTAENTGSITFEVKVQK